MTTPHSHANALPEIYQSREAPKGYPEMKASRAALFSEQIGLQWREHCSDLLIPLNRCRREHPWPWNCEHERHGYEKCLYKMFKHRSNELESRKQQYRERQEQIKQEKLQQEREEKQREQQQRESG